MKFLNLQQNPHENEIIPAKRGVRATPLNPLCIDPCNYFQIILLDYTYDCDIILQVVGKVPDCHRNVFKYLCALLRELLLHSEHNCLEVKLVGM